ncbi:unnamed protein product [Medioppia subpectinata]|uniref:Uncharacterized protein n=1 Tax=Medioppia subpectinata TaxID=1979941 RepID=A0A7R9KYI2_9ACAR|nr:unnamed protein product [Medioppia subpectinata]CAG2111067.1 unnamed protein product [Medioppia subpectinata]
MKFVLIVPIIIIANILNNMSDDYIVRSPKRRYEIPDISVAAYVSRSMARLDPQHRCFMNAIDGSHLTAEELITKCHSVANALIARGITKSDTVLTFAENSTELVIVMFAAIYLGITLYPITPIARVYELDQLMDTLGPLFIFTTKAKAKIIETILSKRSDRQTVRFVAVLDDNHNVYVPFRSLLSEGQNQILDTIPYFAVKPKKDICILLQSSGTTGAPKSVMISHTAFVAALMAFIKPDMNDESGGNNRTSPLVGYQMTQFSCMSGVAVLFGYATCAVNYGVNFMGMVPAFGHKLLNEMCDEYDLSSLKALMVTGAAFAANVAKDIMQKHKVSVVEVYGMTEYCGLTSPDGEYIPGCVGRPSDNTDMKVIDSKGNSLGPDLDGELCVRGPKLFSGYLNNVLATNEAIDDHGWLRTGDIGHYDSRHRFFITDRLKELIKYGTKQVSPTELEQFLLTHEAVAEAVVVGVGHRTDTQWPRAYVRLREHKSVTEEELKRFVADSLSDSKQLRAGVVFVDDIRRTTVGKVERRYYKELVANELIDD